ncbi:hypothetical protein [Kineococcus radiotolerans]|uniref:Uncharacterized protein n=1 Tax=Kineococcus radiotolerans (strain ATCC BAA-149 / DSM 14245 / SRS30216) TaxID=266940 RepID=A6W8Q8_KINRD|nr:hypothetical protein [Kineococcus radiotolerans]ABS03197.1 hypothetical protein Krad_1711 [Kineococcus radiotolerans SRS30216 = ATCC BAA-149]
MWRARHWTDLLDLIDGLPRHSLYMEAVAGDEDLAREWLELELAGEVEEAKPTIRISEWSPEREAEAQIIDALNRVYVATVGVATGKPPKVEPALRPVTALQELRREADMKVVFDFAARVTPSMQQNN